jgi:hypothetical protein
MHHHGHKRVRKYDCGYFSKCFLLLNVSLVFFLKKKIIFNISVSKWYKNIKKILIWNKEKNKKNLILFKNTFETQKQTESYPIVYNN